MEVLGDLNSHSELLARHIRRDDLRDGTGLCTGHPHNSAWLKAGDLLEFGINREFLREGHLPIADHEQADSKQGKSAQHEHPDARQSRRCRH
jgi:hypothetical protein